MKHQENSELFRFTLNNGLRCLLVPNNSRVLHLGVMVNVGSRDENPCEFGAAHFIEHMLFKGTKKRKAFHINSRLDAVGGELNAYTTKEHTFIYAVVMQEHKRRAVELLSDMLLHSIFPLKEVEKERDVILDEFRSSKDDPSDEIMEMADELLFGNHPLAHPILGSHKTVSSLGREQLLSFKNQHYVAENMVLCIIGNLKPHAFRQLCETYFGEIPSGKKFHRILKPVDYVPVHQKVVKRELNNAHSMIFAPAYSLMDDKRLAFSVLNNILGGPAMNTRLSLNVREKYGLTYFLESGFVPYHDAGSWYIYFSTEAGQTARVMRYIHRELKKLREEPLGSLQWINAKHQTRGQIALANESAGHLLHFYARSILVFDDVESTEDLFRQIDGLTPHTLLETAAEIFDPERLSTLHFVPES